MDKEELIRRLNENNKKYNDLHKKWIEIAKAQQFVGIVLVILIIIFLMIGL